MDKEYMRLIRLFPYIWAWQRLTGSYEYYIGNLCAMAEREKAPKLAVYKSVEESRWVTLDEVKNREMVDRVHAKVAELLQGGG